MKYILILISLMSTSAFAMCEQIMVRDCPSCPVRYVQECREDHPQMQGNRGLRDFLDGAKAFEYGVNRYMDSQ